MSKHMYTTSRNSLGLTEAVKVGGFEMKKYLKLYEDDLIVKNLVRQNQVPYMVWWVKYFLSVEQP